MFATKSIEFILYIRSNISDLRRWVTKIRAYKISDCGKPLIPLPNIVLKINTHEQLMFVSRFLFSFVHKFKHQHKNDLFIIHEELSLQELVYNPSFKLFRCLDKPV